MNESEKADRYNELMADARCPKRHRATKITTPEDHAWNKTLAMLKENYGKGFLFGIHGVRGPGKTQLGVEMIRHASMLFHTSLYMRIMDILMDIKSTFGKEAELTERDIMERMCKPKLLVIDECHERKETDWDSRILTYLVDRRYADLKDTLLISNGNEATFATSLGASVGSRMLQCGGFKDCNWDSFRTL